MKTKRARSLDDFEARSVTLFAALAAESLGRPARALRASALCINATAASTPAASERSEPTAPKKATGPLSSEAASPASSRPSAATSVPAGVAAAEPLTSGRERGFVQFEHPT